jgi:hypothetical protein
VYDINTEDVTIKKKKSPILSEKKEKDSIPL